MYNEDRVEQVLLGTKMSLYKAKQAVGLDWEDDFDESLLTVEQCDNCSTWVYSYKLIEQEVEEEKFCQTCDSAFHTKIR